MKYFKTTVTIIHINFIPSLEKESWPQSPLSLCHIFPSPVLTVHVTICPTLDPSESFPQLFQLEKNHFLSLSCPRAVKSEKSYQLCSYTDKDQKFDVHTHLDILFNLPHGQPHPSSGDIDGPVGNPYFILFYFIYSFEQDFYSYTQKSGLMTVHKY